MDPAFAALLNEMKGKGWTDQMIGWLSGAADPTQWGALARQVEQTVFNPAYTPEQRAQLVGAGSWENAQQLAQGFAAPAPATPAPTPTAPPAAPAAPAKPTIEEQRSAFATVQRALDDYGLGTLATWAWGQFQAGYSIDQIMLEVYQRPEFKAIYPEYDILAKKGRAYSIGELQAYRKAVVGIYRSYGIPAQFYDSPEDLATLAAGEVSIAEVSKRVAQAAEAVYQSSPLVRSEMERLYGVGSGDLVAYFLDPSKAEPVIRQNFVSAQIGAQARQTGFGMLTSDEASRLAGIGVDQQAAARGFNTLASSRELFDPLAGESAIGRDTQLGAAFGGDADAMAQVERRRGRRLAEFSEGGGFATSREGIVGVA